MIKVTPHLIFCGNKPDVIQINQGEQEFYLILYVCCVQTNSFGNSVEKKCV